VTISATSGRDPTAVLGRRVVAYIIDIVIPLTLFVALCLALARHYDKHVGAFDLTNVNVCDALKARDNVSVCFETSRAAYTITQGRAVIAFALPLLLSFVNLVVLQGSSGASIGKHVMNLRVVDTDGHDAGLGRAFVRWVLLVVDTLCLIFGLVVAVITHPHRRVGDFVAGTYVIGADADQPIDFASPVPVATTETAATTATTTSDEAPSASAPVWDAQRGAWLSYDPVRRAWLRYDGDSSTWIPL
jgi:uncharacterized RDD family membrane protein YckC